jgi:2-polyprenyl-3-methyl-5-hydroxy-6-metoxy-1,4-benzoquinol methylase
MADALNLAFDLEAIPCPLCRSHQHRSWGEENGFSAVKCADCGLVYVNPRPRSEDIDEGHRIGKHRTPEGDLPGVHSPVWKKVATYKADINAAFAAEIVAGKPLSWLDVGAGYGEFVSALRDTLPKGSSVAGIDPMEAKVAYAQQVGLPVTTTPLAEITGQYDVVSILNVFSHVPDFREFLANLKRLLNPGGSLFIQTGNGGDLTVRSDYPDRLCLPDHLVFAGQVHIERFLREAGFAITGSKTRRKDTLYWSLKSVGKRLVGRPDPVAWPYRSGFRGLWCRAKML